MKISTSISRGLKADYKPFAKTSEKTYRLCWGKRDEVERVFVMNEETGEFEPSGVGKDTDWCSFEACIYQGLLTPYLLDNQVMVKAQRQASVADYKAMYDGLGVGEDEQLSLLRRKLSGIILAYDSSSEVNSFYIGGVQTWIDKATRVGLKLRFEAEKRLGKTETVLWQNGVQFPLPLTGEVTALDMLDGIELYASTCYDTTQMHLAKVESMESVDGVISYDYTSGYPRKLKF